MRLGPLLYFAAALAGGAHWHAAAASETATPPSSPPQQDQGGGTQVGNVQQAQSSFNPLGFPPGKDVLYGEDFAQADIHIRHPASGAIVNVDRKVIVDVQLSFPHLNNTSFDGPLLKGFVICLRLGATDDVQRGLMTPWQCFEQFNELLLTAAKPTQQVLEVALVSRPSIADAEAAMRRYVSSERIPKLTADLDEALLAELNAQTGLISFDRSEFTSEAQDTCAGKLGRDGCGYRIPPHCSSPSKFRFYLYPVSSVPSPHAADLYYSLRDSPMRTLNDNLFLMAKNKTVVDPTTGAEFNVTEIAPLDPPMYQEACVLIAIGDVYASNVRKETPFEASKKFTRLKHWRGTGANHLIISFADYGESLSRVPLSLHPLSSPRFASPRSATLISPLFLASPSFLQRSPLTLAARWLPSRVSGGPSTAVSSARRTPRPCSRCSRFAKDTTSPSPWPSIAATWAPTPTSTSSTSFILGAPAGSRAFPCLTPSLTARTALSPS